MIVFHKTLLDYIVVIGLMNVLKQIVSSSSGLLLQNSITGKEGE